MVVFAQLRHIQEKGHLAGWEGVNSAVFHASAARCLFSA
jgi:hypothetical protein